MLTFCRKRAPRPKIWLSRRRLMRSTGHNIVTVGIEDKYWKFLCDVYTTLIDIKWRWNILIFVSGFVVTWLFFACLYYVLGYLHGDFEEQSSSFVPCIQNVKTFTAAYLFSIETMMTIGYGFRVQTEVCPGVFFTVMLQSVVGAGLQFMLASIVVSKTRRAKRRSETILFSKTVCIYEQDSRLHLAVRIGDMRSSDIAGAHAQGFMIKKYKSKDGSYVPARSYNITLKSESGRDLIFFPWPTQILHLVDEDSPLWSLSREELLTDRYELVVVIDGLSGATGRPFQARKSYHTFEMKWGHRFANLELTYGCGGSYVMSLTNFHKTFPTSAPMCSAQDLTHLREMCQVNPTESMSSDNQGPVTSQPNQVSDNTNSLNSSRTGQSLGSNGSCSETSFNVAQIGQRSYSMKERVVVQKQDTHRRFSLGDMIRVAQGGEMAKRNVYADALNIYKHRISVTDTYLGEQINEEKEQSHSSYKAILSVVAQRSVLKRTDCKDITKRRRHSVQLFFGKESECSEEAEQF